MYHSTYSTTERARFLASYPYQASQKGGQLHLQETHFIWASCGLVIIQLSMLDRRAAPVLIVH